MAGSINAGVVAGILVSALYDPVWTSAIHGKADFGLALLSFGLLTVGRVPPALVVLLAGLAGWVMAMGIEAHSPAQRPAGHGDTLQQFQACASWSFPWPPAFDHGIQDNQQLAHAGHDGHLLRLACRQQTLIATPYHGVVTHGDDGGHVQALLTAARPPQMKRLPRAWPESRFIGATPTSAEICLALSRPSSGSSDISVAAVAGPTPLTLLSKAARSG